MSEKTVAQMQREILSKGELDLKYSRSTALYEAWFKEQDTDVWLKFSAPCFEGLIVKVWNRVCD